MIAQADTTLLFTDIEGSTRILGQVGEATYGEVLELHHELIRSAISQHSGQELGTEGDSFFVMFAAAAEGVGAAVDAQRALAGARWPADVVVRVRM